MSGTEDRPWGRVDEDGTVYVRVAEGELAVGQFPDGTPEEALAYFERKYTDLAGQVTLLEQRARRGAPAPDVARAVATLRKAVAEPHAVGDLAALESRLDALGGTVEVLGEQQQAEADEAKRAAIAERTAIVEEVEALAAVDPAKTQWKQATASLEELFARWQRHQQDGPRLPKSEASALWRRFRTARSTIEKNRRAFFAELDSKHKDAKSQKNEIIARAEALQQKGAAGIPEYRRLLDDWKRAGRAGKGSDDALWARFKAAGDPLFREKAEIDAKTDEEYAENLTAKLVLLEEAEPLLQARDRKSARASLLSIQERWEGIGRVPRDRFREVEDRMRKVETAVRRLDEEHWRRDDPEKKARSEGLASQLGDVISRLEDELEAARRDGDERRIREAQEALDARRSWLNALG